MSYPFGIILHTWWIKLNIKIATKMVQGRHATSVWLMEFELLVFVVPRGGIEPPTQGFSVLDS